MKKKLTQAIADGKTKQAIRNLLTITASLEDKDYHQEVVLQSARYEQYAKNNRIGISSSDEDGISISKINKALLDLIARLPEEAFTTPNHGQTNAGFNKESDNKLKYTLIAIILLSILGGTIAFFWKPLTNSSTAQLTVYVHGMDGPQDYLLENEGELLVDLDGDRRYAKIGEKGRTVFNEIPSKFMHKSILISVKAKGYEAATEKTHFLWEGEAIYFPIQPEKTLGIIKGIVSNENQTQFLKDVLVLINNEFTTLTDSLGRFSFEIPIDQIQDKYNLRFQKENYETLIEYYYPPTVGEFRLKKH